MKKRLFGFTLLELLVTMTIFFSVIALVSKFYLHIIEVKRGLEGKQLLIENGYYMLERMQIQMKNYSIDYEEYFNRRSVGCDETVGSPDLNDFSWDVNSGTVNGHCDQFTSYGNENSFSTDSTYHGLYYCSSMLSSDEISPAFPYTVISSAGNLRLGLGCFQDMSSVPKKNSFGQYHMNFYDANDNVDTVPGSLLDDDDQNLGMGPDAIGNASGVQELYLISPNKEQRVYFRRSLIASGDFNADGMTGGLDVEKLYALQLLKLQGFDIGNDHDLELGATTGLYDGQIDTWACDMQRGFLCGGNSLGGVYSGYHLPVSADDGWVNMFTNDLTISDRNLVLYPTKDPSYARAEDDMQISPYVQISFQAKLYGEDWYRKIGAPVDVYAFSLQTTFALDNLYTK